MAYAAVGKATAELRASVHLIFESSGMMEVVYPESGIAMVDLILIFRIFQFVTGFH